MATESEVAQSAEALRASMQSAAVSASDAAAKQSQLASATSAAYNSLRSLAGGLAQGRAEVSQLNQLYDLAGQALGKTTRAIFDLGGSIPLIGGLFTRAGQLAEEGAKAASQGLQFLNQQIDVTVKQFQEFGTIGALGTQGMTGLRNQMINSGMTMQGFQRTVMANSQALAAFAGTTSEGAEKFSTIVGAITTKGFGDQLRNIGMSADQIGEAAAGFLMREQRLGRAQGMTQEQLTKGAVTYARELDTLARLTGQSADAIRRQQDAAMSESRFRAAIFKMDETTQKRMLATQSLFGSSPAIAKGIRDLVSGVADTQESLELVTLTGGAVQDMMSRLQSGMIDEFQFRKELTEKIRQNAGAFADIAKFGDGAGSVVGNFAQIADVVSTNVEGTKAAVDTQKILSQGQDALTASTVQASRALEQFSRDLMNLVTRLMPFGADINRRFASGITSTLEGAANYFGFPLGPAPSAAPAVPGTPATPQAPAAAAGARRTAAGTLTQGRLPGAPAAAMPSGNPQELLQFEGTSLQNFQQMDSNMQAAILSAAQDFYRDTGQRLRIGSSFRSREQQQALWDNRANNPYPVAPPGTSQHEHGFAVDILNYQAAERYLNQRGLYRPDPRGDRIHFEPGSGDANGISGPRSGYTPSLDSNVNVSAAGGNTNNQTNAADMTVFQEQLARLDRIVSATERQAQLSQQYLSYAS